MIHKPTITRKGTELPLTDLKGKPYMQVAYRLVWFREDHPDWTLDTNLHTLTDQYAIAECRISNEEGRLIAVDRKLVTRQSFPAFIEKATTGAIGRALALCGYGTQFEPEFDEDGIDVKDMVDSPVVKPIRPVESHMELCRKLSGIVTQKRIPKQAYLDFLAKYGTVRVDKLNIESLYDGIEWAEKYKVEMPKVSEEFKKALSEL